MEDQENHVKRESTFPLFSKYFTVHPQNVVDYVGNMKKQMQDFIEAFRKRIDIEINYSKSLTQVSKALDKYIKPGTEYSTSFISSAFKVEHEQRSRQAMELAEALKTEVQSMCSEMLRKELTFYKKMEKDVKRFYKEASSVQQNHRQALSRFEGISRDMQEMIITKNIMKYTTGIPQDKKVKLISKTMDSIRESKQYEKLYLQSVKSFNLFVNAYNEQIKGQLDQAETQIREQVTMQCDCLRKLIVAEVSMFKNIEYDLLNISKQMEYLDNQKEVEIFVEEQKNSTINRIISDDKPEEQGKKPNFTEVPLAQYGLQQKKIVGKSMLSNSLLHVDEEYFSWMLFNKKNKKLRDMVAGIWKQFRGEKEPIKMESTQTNQINPIEGNVSKAVAENQPKVEEKQVPQGEEVVEETRQTGELTVSKKASELSEQAQLSKPSVVDQQQKEVQNEDIEHDWQKQLRQFIGSLKIQRPPCLIVMQTAKKEKPLSTDLVFDSLMEIMKTISQLWNIDGLDPQKANENLTILQKYMGEQHLYRLIALLFLQEYRIQLQVQLKNSDCAKICSRVLRVIIRESQKENDCFIIRGILGLIFTYYWTDQKYKRLLYLSPEIYQCDIWKKHDFWEAAIFETTYEEMAMFAKQKGETGAETMLRQKNIIFSQLASFCHYMVMLGITSKNVRLIVGRYCRLYEMTEEQNKDLSKMITNTTKQFKEISFQFSLKGPQKQKSVINE